MIGILQRSRLINLLFFKELYLSSGGTHASN